MENDIITQFNLPGYLKGKTFADASKAINNKFKDRTDKVSNATKEELLSRLAEAQEYLKMQESLASNSTEVPVMGDVPQEFAEGGSMSEFSGSDYLQAAQGLNMVAGNVIKDETAGNIVNSAISGAGAGAAFGPWGAAIGGALGLGSSLIGELSGGEKTRDEADKQALAQTTSLRSDFKYGGTMKKKYANGGPLDDIFKVTNPLFDNDVSFDSAELPNINKAKGKGLARGVNWLGENFGNIAQYAPIASNALELSQLDKPITERGSRLDNTYNENLFDTNSLVNRVNQNNVNAALEESSTGNLGALRTNILAANLNKDKAVSEAMIQGDQINRDEGRFKFQSDLNRDRVNVGLDQNFLERKDRDEGVYETTKSNLRRQLFEDVGDIGREEVNKKLVRDLFGYKWNGKYFTDEQGNKYTSEEVAEKIKEVE